MSTCSTCRMPVVWGTTASGKPIPLDPDPVENGNLAVRPGGQVRYMKLSEQPEPGEWRAVSHFATCLDAALHRKH